MAETIRRSSRLKSKQDAVEEESMNEDNDQFNAEPPTTGKKKTATKRTGKRSSNQSQGVTPRPAQVRITETPRLSKRRKGKENSEVDPGSNDGSEVPQGPEEEFSPAVLPLIKIVDKAQELTPSHQEDVVDELIVAFKAGILGLTQKGKKKHGLTQEEEFLKQFLAIFNPIFFVSDPSNPGVHNLQKFLIKFALNFKEKSRSEDDPEIFEEPKMSFVVRNRIHGFLGCDKKYVRWRAAEMLASIVEEYEEENVALENHEEMVESLKAHLDDKYFRVQINAVRALSFFQQSDAVNPPCEIMERFVDLMKYDPNWQVRAEVVKSIAIAKWTLVPLVDRIRDPNPNVRAETHKTLGNSVSIKSVNVQLRMKLLTHGLNDSSPKVEESCVQNLLGEWLKECNGNVQELLGKLDLYSSVSTKIMKGIFKLQHVDKVVAELLACDFFDQEGKVVKSFDVSQATVDHVFHWNHVINYVLEEIEDPRKTDLLELILPTSNNLAERVLNFVKSHPPMREEDGIAETGDENLGRQFAHETTMLRETLSQRLLGVLAVAEDGDIFGRNRKRRVLEDLIQDPATNVNLMESLVTQYLDWHEDQVDDAVRWLCETISDLIQPDVAEATRMIDDTQLSVDPVFGEISSPARDPKDEPLSPDPAAQKNLIEEETRTAIRCLKIACAFLSSSKVTKLSEPIRGILNTLIVPSVGKPYPTVRYLAIQSLGLCGVIKQDIAADFFGLFTELIPNGICLDIDVSKLQELCLKIVTDLLLIHGLGIFQSKLRKVETAMAPEDSPGPSLQDSVVNFFLEWAESDKGHAQELAVEGLVKLIYHRKLWSFRALSRLIVAWFNPANADKTHIKNCIAVFFPTFARSDRRNQELILHAFEETMNILYGAEEDSPLSRVSKSRVAEFFRALTNREGLDDRAPGKQEPSVHGDFGNQLCNLILEPPVERQRLLAKVLCDLRLKQGLLSQDFLKDLRANVHHVSEEVQDKACKALMKKALATVEKAISAENEDWTLDETEDRTDPDENRAVDFNAVFNELVHNYEFEQKEAEEESEHDITISVANSALETETIKESNGQRESESGGSTPVPAVDENATDTSVLNSSTKSMRNRRPAKDSTLE